MLKRIEYKRVISFLLALAIMLSTFPFFSVTAEEADANADVWDGTVAAGFESGTGTESDPYIIETAEQLAYLASTTNSGTTYKDKYIKLANDIYLNDTDGWENWNENPPANTWTPIGTSYDYSFHGIFNGDGHVICGIYTDSAKDYQGLFGYIINGTVKNVGIETSYVCGANYVGGVCGVNYYGTVTNCYNTGTVSGTNNLVGGVCGESYRTVTNCYNTGKVSGSTYVGGVCGYNGYDSTVTNCYNTGTVSGTDRYVGGVCGYNRSGTIKNCYNTGTVSGNEGVGGVCGYNYDDGTVTNCYNTGTVSGTSYYVGGVCGYNDSTVTNCYYLIGCAKDGNGVMQYGIGSITTGRTIADVSGRTTGLTDDEMKKQSSFVGFDFDEVWTIKENISYPTLRGMPEQEITEPDEPGNVWDGTVATGFASGTGTEDDPYIIETPEQLAYLVSSVNGGTTYEGKYFKLSNDIYLNDTDGWENWDKTAPKNMWTPIGTGKYFKGTFDGDGHVIYGIYIDSTKNYQGLFGYVYKGTVKNVGIETSYVCGANYVGGVCGYNGYDSTVTNCYNTGTVSGSTYVGGVCGYSDDGTVTNCYNTGTVNGTNNSVGGVCGRNGSTVTNCYNTGTVSGTSYYVGGVCGNNEGTVTNCYNTGTVSGSSRVGGVCGHNDSHVTNCYNTGTVSGTDTCVGGVCGENYGTVTNCYNTGTVSGNSYVGGVCGYNSPGTIKNCYNTGTVSGSYDVGGVCGYSYDGTVTNCYNTGTVSGTDTNVGGVCGYKYYGTIINCYNTGTVSGNSYVGGVCGGSNGTVTNCYYLIGCAKDGNSVTQYGIGNKTKGKTTADVSGRTTGLTDDEMKKQSSFVGFDFDEVWTIKENISYPTLRGMPEQEITEPDEPGNVWDGTAATGFASGTGTEDDPYIIETPEQLAYLSSTVNAGTTYEGKYFKLANDIYLNDTDGWENWGESAPANTWTAIGTETNYFSGTFDGGVHAIYGVFTDSSKNYQGMFGHIYGTVKNIGVEESFICGGRFVGGVCGYNEGTVTNCYNSGSIRCTLWYVGGVCGENNEGTISNCYNEGIVSGGDDTGGVCGYDFAGSIKNCYNIGKVSGKDNVGGICGINNGYNLGVSIIHCYNSGNVSGFSDVGGLCGDNTDGTITNCYNTGTISGNFVVGGICGINWCGTDGGNGSIIDNCYNAGTINGILSYDSYDIGGVCGRNDGSTITNCYNTGIVNGNDSHAVGGVCGYNSRSTSAGVITDCYNNGTVRGNYYAGCVCGDNDGTVTRCYYLIGCATDGNGTVQYGIGNDSKGRTTADISGQTTGLTDSQMKQQASFVGFDFDTVWTMNGNPDYPYPELVDNTHEIIEHTHSYIENAHPKYLVSAATCNKKAVYYKSCEVCGEKSSETFEYGEFDPSNHVGDTYIQGQKNATCSENGYTGDTYCSDCDKKIASGTIITAKEHTPGEWEIETPATCTSTGTKVRKCTVCHKVTERETIPMADHELESTVVPATPDAQGYILHQCKHCTYSYKDNYVEYVEHNPAKIVVESKRATCGQSFTVDVTVKNNPGFAYLELTPVYSDKLTLVSVTNGELISDLTKGKQYVWVADEDVLTDGKLMTFNFLTDSDVEPGEYQVGFIVRLCVNIDEKIVDVVVENATIEIIDFTYGDANGDGVINGQDVVRIKKYLANYDYDTETSTIEINAGADANGDGVINGQDVVRLKKYLANYDYDTETSTIVLGPQN